MWEVNRIIDSEGLETDQGMERAIRRVVEYAAHQQSAEQAETALQIISGRFGIDQQQLSTWLNQVSDGDRTTPPENGPGNGEPVSRAAEIVEV